MSDTVRPKSAGDKLAAAEVNADLPVQINAGETIDTSSTPQAVYIKAADNEVYKTDANVIGETVKSFIGFAVTDGSDGNPCTIQHHGIVAGFSGLTEGAKYYLSDTPGAISSTPGTYPRLVGIAISATQILIMADETHVKVGTDSRAGNAASGTVNIAHGLGRAPKAIRVIAVGGSATAYLLMQSIAFSDGVNSACIGFYQDTSKAVPFAAGNIILIRSELNNPHDDSQIATLTVDDTNLIFAWVKANDGVPGTITITWEAET